ncbi:V-set domain containing T-cell activation inhibitor 1-like isoform X1 [Heterodontus francisci]|uniref:V-set domain containing T-cell activation inhibitor 1-like isoform X1 n=1 Tax=Heterodontus francisci TaxID=7792 RepID=UPI00355C7385
MMLDDFRVFGKALQLSVTISTENAAEQENGIIHSPDKTAGGYIGGNNGSWNIKSIIPCLIIMAKIAQASGHNISARVGGDVLLPCKSDPNGIAKGSIYWQKVKPNIVAWYWNKGKEDSQYQDPQYRNRTLIANSEVIRGNLSLLIQGLQLNDSGEYECIVSKKGSMTAERLIVRLAVNNSKMETEVNTKPDSFDNYTKPNNTDGEHHVRHHYGVIGSFIFFTIAFVLFLVLWKISKSSAME